MAFPRLKPLWLLSVRWTGIKWEWSAQVLLSLGALFISNELETMFRAYQLVNRLTQWHAHQWDFCFWWQPITVAQRDCEGAHGEASCLSFSQQFAVRRSGMVPWYETLEFLFWLDFFCRGNFQLVDLEWWVLKLIYLPKPLKVWAIRSSTCLHLCRK